MAVALPEAQICHQSARRLRIKIASRKGKPDYFSELREVLSRHAKFENVTVNSLTGSVLFIGDGANVTEITEFAKTNQLFELSAPDTSRSPMTTQLVSHLDSLNINIRRLTSGEMDLAGIILLFLLISGLTEIIRGNLRLPPWYTAFWYAFGIYKLASVVKEKNPEEV
jgi:hypothetical protein